ncbi:MAG: hypothetical protein ACOYOS_12265 [Syntrophales bacterium]
MAKFKKEDVAGIRLDDGKMACSSCMADEEWLELSLGAVITNDEIAKSGELYFCDDCKLRMF